MGVLKQLKIKNLYRGPAAYWAWRRTYGCINGWSRIEQDQAKQDKLLTKFSDRVSGNLNRKDKLRAICTAAGHRRQLAAACEWNSVQSLVGNAMITCMPHAVVDLPEGCKLNPHWACDRQNWCVHCRSRAAYSHLAQLQALCKQVESRKLVIGCHMINFTFPVRIPECTDEIDKLYLEFKDRQREHSTIVKNFCRSLKLRWGFWHMSWSAVRQQYVNDMDLDINIRLGINSLSYKPLKLPDGDLTHTKWFEFNTGQFYRICGAASRSFSFTKTLFDSVPNSVHVAAAAAAGDGSWKYSSWRTP